MPRSLLVCLFALTAVTAIGIGPAAEAQGSGRTVPRCDVPEQFEGRDPSPLSLHDALDALLAIELDIDGMEDVMGRAILKGTSAHVGQLKQVVDRYLCSPELAYRAMISLRLLGEPDRYFLDIVEARDPGNGRNETQRMATYALYTLSVAPSISGYDEVRRIMAFVIQEDPIYLPDLRSYEISLAEQGTPPPDPLTAIDHIRPALPVAERIYETALQHISRTITGGVYLAEIDTLYLTELYDSFDAMHGKEIYRLRQFARTHPAATAAALAQAQAHLGSDDMPLLVFVERDDDALLPPDSALLFPGEIVNIAVDVGGLVEETTPGLKNAPPVDASANIEPAFECVRAFTTRWGDGLAAVFSYTFDGPGAVSIPHGSANRLSARDGEQPEAFYPSAAPPDPTFEPRWQVALDPGQTITWTVGARTAVASADGPRCDAAPPPAVDPTGLSAALVLDGEALAAGSIVSNNFRVDGNDHDLGGQLTGAPGTHGIATTEALRQTALAAIPAGRLGRITGVGPAPDIVALDPGLDLEALAQAVLAHPDLLTLTEAPPGPLGTAAAPVVVYVPGPAAQVPQAYQGFGILLADGKVQMATGSEWVGLVVSRSASPEIRLGGNARILGGAAATGGPVSLRLYNQATILRSRAALDLALGALGSTP